MHFVAVEQLGRLGVGGGTRRRHQRWGRRCSQEAPLVEERGIIPTKCAATRRAVVFVFDIGGIM